jgi:NAD(P)-dependent dehydrogenase (short-subunit alcohol dehydrogenase family)
LLSQVLLTLHLLPSLARAPEPRIVCTTSCIHHLGTLDLDHFDCSPGMKGIDYHSNKLYFQMWVAELQCRMLKIPEYLHVTINGVHPGFVASGLWEILNNANWVGNRILNFLLRFVAITPQQGSLAITNAATNPVFGPDPRTQGVGEDVGRGGGKYINRIWEMVPKAHCDDPEARARVWRKLDEELHLEEKGLLKVLGL